MPTLFKIADEIEFLMGQILKIRNEGEDVVDLDLMLGEYQGGFRDKFLNVVKYALGLISEAKSVREMIKVNEKRALRLDKDAQWLMTYAACLAERIGMAPTVGKTAGTTPLLRDDELQTFWRYSTSSECVEWQQTPEDYIEDVPATTKIDKAAIRKDLLAGKDVPGWKLITKTTIQAT